MSFATIPAGWALSDPFAASADPSAYVPRTGTERALAGLEEALRSGAGCALLVGEAGLGKSMLLRVLEKRLARECLTAYLPYPALPIAGLCAWARALLGLPPGNDRVARLHERARWAGALLGLRAGADPVARLLERARLGTRGRPGLVLLLDDVADVPEATLIELGRLAADSRGTLQLVGATDPAGACLVADAWNGLAPMRMVEPMGLEDLRRYVHTLLVRVQGRAGEAPFDDTGLARLHARTGGVPCRVNAEAARLLCARPRS